ncbi:MAG TPA: serine/threonine-protein kinase [Gammaproteobacteria bacterium]
MAEAAAVAPAGPAPARLGKYALQRELGRGSSGIVYLGHDPFENRDVAIKVYYRDDQLEGQQAALQSRLFFNEAHLAGQLKHPNILPIHDAGEEDGRRYVVMEFLPDSVALSKYARADSLLPMSKVVEIFFSTAKALEYAHRSGVVHRDIKPANILMNARGHTLIVDFGIAKSARRPDDELAGSIGTPRYMSPEQVRGEDVNHQTDLYSLGVTVYELLTGMSPFFAESLKDLTHRIMHAEPVPPSRYRVDVPGILDRVIMRCLRKEPRRRYRSGLDIAGDLAYIFDEINAATQELDEDARVKLSRRLAFFDGFNDGELREVVRAGQWRNLASGRNIVTEGELDDSFFVLVSGEVSVWKGDTELGVLREGDCFGEMGFFNHIKRTATIRARGTVDLLVLSAAAIERAPKDVQLKFHRVFVRTLIERLAKTNERLLAAKL